MSGKKGKANGEDPHLLERLFEIIESRRDADTCTSHTAKLLAKGPRKIAQKVGEEATEVVIEGVSGDKVALAAESADLLYHLLVLWAARGLKPQEVWAELESRMGRSGVAEKNARP